MEIERKETLKSIFFVYSKGEKIMILNLEDSLSEKDNLFFNGWKHTSTINPAILLEYFHNNEKDFNWNTLNETLTK